jgi:hypothetical protein
MRWFLLAIVFCLLTMETVAQSGFAIIGRIGATDQEAQEGYFAIDNETMIMVKLNSELHNYLRARVGQRVRVTIEQQTSTD